MSPMLSASPMTFRISDVKSIKTSRRFSSDSQIMGVFRHLVLEIETHQGVQFVVELESSGATDKEAEVKLWPLWNDVGGPVKRR